MPLVSISINGRSYDVSCGDGQETHLRGLAAELNDRVNQLVKVNGPIDESRLLVMASILLADDLQVEQAQHRKTTKRLAHAQEAVEQAAMGDGGNMDQATAYIADIFNDVSDRLERVATQLEN